MSSSETLDVAAKAFGFALVVFGAIFGVLRFGFGIGAAKTENDADKKAIETAVTNGFALVRQELRSELSEVKSSVVSLGTALGSRIDGVSSRMDRVERHREEDVKARAIEAAADQQRRIDEAARRATAEERERTLQAAVAEMRDDLDELVKAQGVERLALRDQLHDHGSRITALEREVRAPESAE